MKSNTMYRHILFGLTIPVLTGCSSHEPGPRTNEIVKVGLATGGCYGPCPFLAIEVDSSLNYRFYGGEFSGKEGFYVGHVAPAFWDTLNLLFEQAKHRSFKEPDWHVADAMIYELVIHGNDTTRHFMLPDIEVPPLPGEELTHDELVAKRMQHVLRWLMHTYKDVPLEQVNDTLDFETVLQYPPPTPKIETASFTAPEE